MVQAKISNKSVMANVGVNPANVDNSAVKLVKGDRGVVFTPYVDNLSNLSWSNDGNLPKPPTRNIRGMYKYKGSVAAVANLPSSGNTTGDVYNVEDGGMNYAWDGTKWDALGEIFTITAVTNTEIDTILAS